MPQKKIVSYTDPDKVKDEEPKEKKDPGAETEVKNANAAGLGAIGNSEQKISPEESKEEQNKSHEPPPY